MRYTEIFKDDLVKLRDGLEVIERVDVGLLDIWFYGITTKDTLLDYAKEAIAADSGEYESYFDTSGNTTLKNEDMGLTDIAIAIQLSTDVINLLLGTGEAITGLTFVYQGEEGQGVKSLEFKGDDTHIANIRLDVFSTMAVSAVDHELKEFYAEKGSGVPSSVNHKIERTEDATTPEEEEEPTEETVEETVEPEPVSPSAKPTGITSSVQGVKKLSDLLEEFLG